jgi:predicted nucleic acid-binding protein
VSAVLVDSSVLLDVLEDDAHWFAWSKAHLIRLSEANVLLINPVVYSEVSVGFERLEELEATLAAAGLEYQEVPREALFLAAKAFLTYRRQGGVRSAPLPDFYIGAHAAVLGVPLLTRDPRRVRRLFPSVALICPDRH